MSTPYLISKYTPPHTLPCHEKAVALTWGNRGLDPIFAMSVGIAAAAVRINREEKEQGKTTEQTIASFKRRIDLAWNGASETAKKGN